MIQMCLMTFFYVKQWEFKKKTGRIPELYVKMYEKRGETRLSEKA